jgi:hypothetical protein
MIVIDRKSKRNERLGISDYCGNFENSDSGQIR